MDINKIKKREQKEIEKEEARVLKDSNFWQYLYGITYKKNNIDVEDIVKAWEYATYTVVQERPFSSDFEELCKAVIGGYTRYKSYKRLFRK